LADEMLQALLAYLHEGESQTMTTLAHYVTSRQSGPVSTSQSPKVIHLAGKLFSRASRELQRSEAYLNDLQMKSPGQGTPVFAVNLPFWELRDVGTSLM
jgi:hypothetical protein